MRFTEALPKFSVNEDIRGELPVEVTFNSLTGTYTIPDVPTGIYQVSVSIDAAEPFDDISLSPGDFLTYKMYNDESIVVPGLVSKEKRTLNHDLRVMQVIHLTSPVDNVQELGRTDEPKPTHGRTSLRFSWDRLTEATSYNVQINNRWSPTGGYIPIINRDTSDTEVVAFLTAIESNRYYSFELLAYNSQNHIIGMLWVNYTNTSYGTPDYRFRIE